MVLIALTTTSCSSTSCSRWSHHRYGDDGHVHHTAPHGVDGLHPHSGGDVDGADDHRADDLIAWGGTHMMTLRDRPSDIPLME